VLWLLTQASSLAWAAARPSNTRPVRNSWRSVRCSRSILPVVWGRLGAVSRWSIPFSRQIRSNRTSVSLRPNRPVNTFPLSVRTSWGTPWLRMASAKWAHTARGGRSEHHPGTDHEPGVVVQTGQDLALGAVLQQDPRRPRPSATAPLAHPAPTGGTVGHGAA